MSNIANFRNYKPHISATFDIPSFQPKSTPLAVLLLKNLRGRKRCAALPKRCSPQIRKFDLWRKCFKKRNLMWLCWILELGAKCQKTACIGLNQLGTDYIQRAESKVKLLQVLKYKVSTLYWCTGSFYSLCKFISYISKLLPTNDNWSALCSRSGSSLMPKWWTRVTYVA